MAKDRHIRLQRCQDTLELLSASGCCSFFTLTTPDRVGLHEIRERWRKFRNSLTVRLSRSGSRIRYVMNYELHPGYLQKLVKARRGFVRVIRGTGVSHGWHIHGVMDARVPVRDIRALLSSAGFGRTDIRPVTTSGVCDYLTKHAMKAYRGMTRKERQAYRGMRLRLVNTSRGLPRLDDYAWDSDLIRKTRMIRERIKALMGDPGRHDFRRVHQVAELCALMDLDGMDEFTRWAKEVIFLTENMGKTAPREKVSKYANRSEGVRPYDYMVGAPSDPGAS